MPKPSSVRSFRQEEVKTALDNMGIPNSSINLALSDGSLMSSADGEILITLTEKHGPTANYVKAIRKALAEKMPEMSSSSSRQTSAHRC